MSQKHHKYIYIVITIIFLTNRERLWYAASWELNRLHPYRGSTKLSLWYKTPFSIFDSLPCFLSLSTENYQAIQDIQIIILKTVVDWCRCSKSPSEARSLCVFTKVYHSSGSTDLRPLISSLRSQTHNDPHLSENVQLVNDTQREWELRWSRRKRTVTPWGTFCLPHREFIFTGLMMAL